MIQKEFKFFFIKKKYYISGDSEKRERNSRIRMLSESFRSKRRNHCTKIRYPIKILRKCGLLFFF